MYGTQIHKTMKYTKLFGAMVIGIMVSCGGGEKKEKKEVPVEKKEVALNGKELFANNTCTSCHQEDTKLIGPALKDIANKYIETGADMVKFLKGEGEAIVVTDPSQVAIMQANFAVTKQLSDPELQAIVDYIKSVK